MKTCPACQAENHIAVQQCECGYSFASGFVEPRLDPATDERVAGSLIGSSGSYATPTFGGGGSLILGILLGFFCSCLGPIIAFAGNMGGETKKGSLIGFGISIAISMVSQLLSHL